MFLEFLCSLTHQDVTILITLFAGLIAYKSMQAFNNYWDRFIKVHMLRARLLNSDILCEDLDPDDPKTLNRMRNRFHAASIVDLLSLVPEYIQGDDQYDLHELRDIIQRERKNIIYRSTDMDNDELLGILLRLNIRTSQLAKRFRDLSYDISMNCKNAEIPETFFAQEETLTDTSLYGIIERIINTYYEHRYQEKLKLARSWYSLRNDSDDIGSDEEPCKEREALVVRRKSSNCCNQQPVECTECDHSRGHPDTPRPATPVAPIVPVVPRKSSESHIEIPETLHLVVPEMPVDRVDTPLSVN